MNNLFTFTLMGGAAFAVLNFHIILFNYSIQVLQKTGLRFEHIVVDARGNNALKMLFHA